VFFGLFYLLLRRVVRLIAGSSNDELSTEVVVLVLRHQLKVFKRQVGRPRLRRRDRLFMAAISRVLPRARWSSFLVSPTDAPSVAPGAREAEVDLRAEVSRRQATDPR
jgi:putative transposase